MNCSGVLSLDREVLRGGSFLGLKVFLHGSSAMIK